MSVLTDTVSYRITPARPALGRGEDRPAGYLDLVGGRGPVGGRQPGASGRR
jgi:hypothetical protein